MRTESRSWRAAVVPTAAALLMLALLVSLGAWQLGRAAEKRELIARYAERAAEPPVELTPGSAPADARRVAALRFRRAVLEGTYLRGHQYLLDNRTHRGAAGYEVLTPLRDARSATLVLVNRGWVPLGARRSELPDLTLPDIPVRVSATLADPPRPGLLLGETGYDEDTWPRVVQYVDLERISSELGAPLLPLVARLDPQEPHGYVRDWQPFYGIPPQRHLGYAVQWFALALALVVLCIYLGVKRRSVDDGE